MKKSIALGLAAIVALTLQVEKAEAGFGDAVVGGVVGGVVGSVITNEIYHSGRRHRTTRRSSRKRRASRVVETDEMKIQRALKSLGYYRGPIDGQINSFETRNAIKELNRAYEIGDTAYMSPQERDALIYLGTLLQLDRNLIAQGTDRRTKTRRIQAALKVLGFYTGKVDGSTGPMTRRAISEYRQANGMAPGYRLGYEEEYRLVTTAKQANDRNIEETLASLKRLGAGARPQPSLQQPMAPAAPQQPVILQPAQPQAPVQPTITQSAPAPVAPAPMPPQPVTQNAAPVVPAPAPLPAAHPSEAAPVPAPQSAPNAVPQPQQQEPEPVVLQPAQ
jgi:peptidoglycan hydrolase-like protein with peptidoglycan-binding domain